MDSRQGFDFEIHDALHLFLREIPYLGLAKIDIFDFGIGQTPAGGLDFVFGYPKVFGRPIVEFFGIIAKSRLALFFHPLQNLVDDFSDLRDIFLRPFNGLF